MQHDDATRELDKIIHALKWASSHLTRLDESNASRHLAAEVLHTPLTVAVHRASQGAAKLREFLTTQPPNESELRSLAQIVADLDRCPHGRHEGDTCIGWTGPGTYQGGCEGGISLGNPHLQTGDHLGYAYSATPYLMPERDRRNDPEAWKA
ncbi:hypothetical protein [Actinomadura violacea]|uniref:Uncharacterized protein n=1 Tax=Actinomadura violacea TaxID=2819934 RepID=A0ABS3RWL2_9ACTN|nr:hypothetical protein [Actinomadura violacea]MBO2461152.1 hypothetical protein [Actinomadura violacea]